jgi:hypothetical protein
MGFEVEPLKVFIAVAEPEKGHNGAVLDLPLRVRHSGCGCRFKTG